MQLQIAKSAQLPEDLYLRIEEEYWIEEKYLEHLVAWVPIEVEMGMKRLGDLLRQRQEEKAQKSKEEVVAANRRVEEAAEAERARKEANQAASRNIYNRFAIALSQLTAQHSDPDVLAHHEQALLNTLSLEERKCIIAEADRQEEKRLVKEAEVKRLARERQVKEKAECSQVPSQ